MHNDSVKYIKRRIFKKVANHLSNKEISLIIGPRQVGKTVLLKQLQEYLIKNKRVNSKLIYYFNLDIIQDKKLFENQAEFIEFIKQKSVKNKIYIFVDEAQKVKEAGVFFKGVYDSCLPVKLILTGSSNLEIRSKIHETLTGRKRVFHLLPFSFSEILNYKNIDLYKLTVNNSKIFDYDKKEIFKIFFEYCVFGGYPQVVLAQDYEEKIEFLREIYTSYIEKDIIGFLRIENENNFNKLVKLLSAQISNLINVAELSSLVSTDRYTIDRYLMNLEKTFVVYNLKPFFSNPRQELIKAAKVYFIDNGLRNLSLENLNSSFISREDKGQLLENAVLKELLLLKYVRNFNLKFWRSKQKAEVDFIIERGLDILPIEVKSNLLSDKLEASFIGFIKRYKPKKALIVNLGYQGKRKINDIEVFFIYPYEIENYIL
ncbi:ATP-binding protein [Candidatus Parcubacteria bacterium]|nr:ATP-binding protein [Candidatus Parcubacteria bacterium]